MIKVIVSDFSRTLLLPIDESYGGGLNALHENLKDRVDYDIWKHYRLNQNLLDLYKTIGSRINIYMFTTGYIQEWPPLKEKLNGVFREVFSSIRLDFKKDDPQSYKIIAKKVGCDLSEILYIDDEQVNLDAAKEAGMAVIRFESEQQAIKDIGKELENFSP